MAARSIIEDVEEYMYFEDTMVDKISSWARNNCETFTSKDPRSQEQPLSHSQLHEEFCSIFETLISNFLHEKSITMMDFYEQLKFEKQMYDQGRRQCTFSSVLLSATDFFAFCDMMHDVHNGGEVVFCPPLIETSDLPDTSISAADSKPASTIENRGKTSLQNICDSKDLSSDAKYCDDNGAKGISCDYK